MQHSYFDVPLPTVIGHRGAAAEAPENTLPSFARALEVGAHILESDVHATSDGVPVLAHDDTLARMTGSPQSIASLTFEQLVALDAGFGFEGPDGDYPARGRGVCIPSLREAFETFPDARFNLEIKAEAPELVERVVDLIGELDRADRTLLAAEHDDIMARIRSETKRRGIAPAIGASVGDVLAHVRAAVERSAPDCEAMALQIPTEFGGQPLITEALVEHAHAHGVVVHAWTINELAEADRLVALGVDGLVTDDPRRMREHLHPA